MDKWLVERQETVNYDKTFDCVQCGYCLPACPTYETMQKETHSPRGRIHLVQQYAEGKIDLSTLRDPIDKCLGCNACTAVCPTGVEYHKILEGAKRALEENEPNPKPKKQQWFERMLYEKVFPSRSWMNVVGNATWFFQKSGLQTFAQKTGLMKFAPLHLDRFSEVLPEHLPSPGERSRRPRFIPAEGRAKATVGFFTGCIMDSVFFNINAKTIDLLTKAGANVVLPEAQTCCGALHAHSGRVEFSKTLAKRNIEAFAAKEVEIIVANAGGCGARLIEYGELFADKPEWRERARKFVEKTKDISEVLVDLDGWTLTKPVHETVTYQTSCHLLNVQRVEEAPLQLIQSIPGIEYREMEGADRCCGSGGIYNIVQYDESMRILDGKMDHVKATEAATIVTANPGCHLQMKLGIQREGLEQAMRAVHLVELLWEAGPERKEE